MENSTRVTPTLTGETPPPLATDRQTTDMNMATDGERQKAEEELMELQSRRLSLQRSPPIRPVPSPPKERPGKRDREKDSPMEGSETVEGGYMM